MLELLLLASLAQEAVPFWFTSEEGSFSVRFPGVPRESATALPSGEKRLSYLLEEGDASYLVTLACLTQEDRRLAPRKVLDSGREFGRAVMHAMGEKIVSERRLQVSGYPASEFVGRAPNQLLNYGRVVVSKTVFYSLAATPRTSAGNDKALRFLSSFAVLRSSAKALCQP